MDKHTILHQYFGHTQFRTGQEELIDHILAGQDVLGIMPTGAGKSICYQVPALVLDGITIVVSPLISLMQDQVSALVQSGVAAACINSSLTMQEYKAVLQNAMKGQYKILYVAPERLVVQDFLSFVSQASIAMVTVDEAHCVSQWGQDFRPSYLKIVEFINRLGYRPIVSAFTATATQEVRDDVINILGLAKPYVITTGFDRKNLFFSVQKPDDKATALLALVEQNSRKSGIVYCATRKIVEDVCNTLRRQGYAATRYHAGLSDSERNVNQDDFTYDRATVMVATNAFGMGIDKSNVSFVIHYNMPKNIESYYQEAGRAGRDGESAECVLLYSGQDVRINQFLIENSDGNDQLTEDERQSIRERDRERLKAMTIYCTTTNCLREYILRYFGEISSNFCGNCSNCNTHFDTVDITLEAQKIVSCVYRIVQRKRSFGKTMIADILRGSKNAKIKQFNLDTLSTYGIMSDVPAHRIRTILDFLIETNYLILTSGQYPTVDLSNQSADIIKSREPITMKLPKEVKPIPKNSVANSLDNQLFSSLKNLRSALAAEAHVPAYIVFSDAALRDMCRKLPQSKQQFLQVSGVGSVKAEKYGERFINVISQHVSRQPGITS